MTEPLVPPTRARSARLGVGRLGVMRLGFTWEKFFAHVDDLKAHVKALEAQVGALRAGQDEHTRQLAELRPKFQQGAETTNAKRRAETQKIANAIAAIQRKGRATTYKAAAIVYLAKHDPAWLAGTDQERDRKQEALLKRLRTHRKNSGRTPD